MGKYKNIQNTSWYDFEDDEDQYYSNWKRRGYKNKKKYTNNWSSYWDYKSDYWEKDKEDDDEGNLCIIEPEGYLTPSKSDMSKKSVLCGKRYLSNLTTSANTTTSYAWGPGEIEKESSSFIKNMSRYFYHSLLENEDFFIDSISEEDKIKYETIIDRVKDIKLPYSTPLEKAIFIHNKIYKEKEDKDKSIEDVISPKKLMSLLDRIDLNTDIYNEKDINDVLDKILVPGGIMGGSPFDPIIKDGYPISTNSINKLHLIDKISLLKSWGESFKISKEIKKEPIYNSDRKEYMHMTSIEQIINMDLYQILFPNFKYKLASNNLHINIPVKKEEKKQKIILLIDDSGSMGYKEKVEWVLALLADRLKECRKEEAELFVSKFENSANQQRFKFHHVYDEKSFNTFIDTFKYNPRGGKK